MKLDGQLENAQLQEVSNTNPTPRVRSRIYSDITDTGNPIPKYHDGARYCQMRLRKEALQSVSGDTILTAVAEKVQCDATGAAIALTLPAASSMTGESLYIQKLDTTFNKVVITAAGADTIDGAAHSDLTSYLEWVEIRSNGTGWNTLDWGYYEGRVAFTPTSNMATNTTLTGYWWRTGNRINLEYLLAFAGAPDAVSLALNTPVAIKTSEILNTSATSGVVMGSGTFWDNSATSHYILSALYASASTVRVVYDLGTGIVASFTQAAPVTVAVSDKLWIRLLDLPVTGWRAFWAL